MTTMTRRQFAIRWVTTAATAAITGTLAYWLADGTLNLLATCIATPNSVDFSSVSCTEPGNAPTAIGWIGAITGGWFTATGRLARLFRKVD